MRNVKRDLRSCDDHLAEFTNRLLDKEAPEEMEISPTTEKELRELQETVVFVKQALGPKDKPGRATADRIRTNLLAAWRKFGLGAQSRQPKWRSIITGQRTLALRLAVAIVVVLLTAVFLSPTLDEILPGAAKGRIILIPAILIIVITSTLIILLMRSKRKGG